MNKGLKIALIVSAILLSLGIFYSIKGPMDFNVDRDDRYVNVIAQLQDIGALQKEYLNQTGRFTEGIDTLISFADTAYYVIKERRDTTIYVRNAQGINIPQDKTLFRELARIRVKDSLFKNRDFKGLGSKRVGDMKPYHTELRRDYKLNADSTAYSTTYFFKTYATKKEILEGLNENLIINEINDGKPIADTILSVGSMANVSTEGNWTPEFDYLANEYNKELNSESESKSK